MGEREPIPVDQLADEVIRDDVAKNGGKGRPGKQAKATVLRDTVTRPGVLVPAAILAAAGVALIAVALSGGFGGGSSAPSRSTSSAPLLTGGDGTQRFIYWQGHATSYSGCATNGPTSSGATTNYAGNMWMSKGTLYASGIEFSGNFKGTLYADGTFEVATPVTPGYASTFSGRITPHGNTGTFSGTFKNRVSGGCFAHGVMSGHVALSSGGFGPGAKIAA